MSDKKKSTEPSKNGVKKAVVMPAHQTEVELRATTPPEKHKGFRVLLGDQVRFVWGRSPARAIHDVVVSLGAKAVRLDKAPNVDSVMKDILCLPPEHMRELVARVNASASIAGPAPTAGSKK